MKKHAFIVVFDGDNPRKDLAFQDGDLSIIESKIANIYDNIGKSTSKFVNFEVRLMLDPPDKIEERLQDDLPNVVGAILDGTTSESAETAIIKFEDLCDQLGLFNLDGDRLPLTVELDYFFLYHIYSEESRGEDSDVGFGSNISNRIHELAHSKLEYTNFQLLDVSTGTPTSVLLRNIKLGVRHMASNRRKNAMRRKPA